MKKTAIWLLLALAATTAFGQPATKQQKNNVKDSAEWVVDKYLRLMNIDGLRTDSILYMESIIYYTSDPTDTAIMKRWYLAPNRFRVELWHRDTLLEGTYTDGKRTFREYNNKVLDGWTRISDSRYYDLLSMYDFRGALYGWRADGSELTYQGIWNFEDNKVYRIYVEAPNRYNSYYFFEKESGLLFLVQQTEHHSSYSNHRALHHPDLHGIHEYYPIGAALLPSVESFQLEGDKMLYFTSYHFQPVNMDLFTKDNQ